MAPLALGSINPFVASFIVTNNQMWLCLGFPRGLSGKESACKCRRCGFHPRVGKVPSRRKWQLLQHSCLGNPTDAGAWWAAVHGVAKSRTQLKRLTIHTQLRNLWGRLSKMLKFGESVGLLSRKLTGAFKRSEITALVVAWWWPSVGLLVSLV